MDIVLLNTKPIALHSTNAVSTDLSRRRQRRPSEGKTTQMHQVLRLSAGILFILGSFLAVSKFAQIEGIPGESLRAQRLRSRQVSTDNSVDIEKAAILFLNKEAKEEQPKDDLLNIYEQLDDLSECNRTLDTPLLRVLLNSSASDLEGYDGGSKTLYLVHLLAKHTYLVSQRKLNLSVGRRNEPSQILAMPLNATLTGSPAVRPPNRSVIHVLQLLCDEKAEHKQWVPLAIYPTSVANSYLQVQLPQISINACSFAHCRDSKVSFNEIAKEERPAKGERKFLIPMSLRFLRHLLG